MKFISARDLRNRPGFVQELVQKEDLVLTSNGKPVALLLRIGEDNFEETLGVVTQVRAMQALAKLRKQAAERGLDKLTPEDIDKEIRAVRAQRKAR